MTPTSDIVKILSDMRKAIDNGLFDPVERGKNMHTLALLGIDWEDVKQEIYELTTSEYLQGPEIDRDYPETEPFWMFKKNIDGQIIYIKFKVLYDSDGGVKLVSFHLDEK